MRYKRKRTRKFYKAMAKKARLLVAITNDKARRADRHQAEQRKQYSLRFNW